MIVTLWNPPKKVIYNNLNVKGFIDDCTKITTVCGTVVGIREKEN